MAKITEQALTASCYSEYDCLRKVVLCKPSYMKIREIINETQKHFIHENINSELANAQHESLRKTLESQGVEVILLPAQQEFPEQVFTRDIGFTLGETVFISEMGRHIRQGEEQVLKKWLNEHEIHHYDLKEGSIEGGDVSIDRKIIWIGISNRTSEKAIKQLQQLLPDFQIIPVPFEGKYLHLDCVFNVLSSNEALIFSPAFQQKELILLSSHYKLIEVTEEEQFTLGTNILSLGNKTIISLPVNKNVNKQLEKHGYNVIEVDISEIIKSGGSFRCITLPILRKN
jgi:N-dimethylarginine dimethylaminohydrolase